MSQSLVHRIPVVQVGKAEDQTETRSLQVFQDAKRLGTDDPPPAPLQANLLSFLFDVFDWRFQLKIVTQLSALTGKLKLRH
jgi:hypothetical protein